MADSWVVGGAASSGKGAKKTDTKKTATAVKQTKSTVERIKSASAPQNPTLTSYANTGQQGYQEQENASKLGKLERIGSSILAQINRPSQGVLRGIQAQQAGGGVADIARGVGRGLATGTGEDTVNFRGALNTDNFMRAGGYTPEEAERAAENQGGRAAGAVDLVGTAVLDPTTYLGVGGLARLGGAGRSGARAIEKAAGKEVAEQVVNQGSKSLSPEKLAALRTALHASEEAGRARGGATKYVDSLIGGEGNRLTRRLGALEEAQGLKIGTKTVLKRATTDKALAAFPGALRARQLIDGFEPIQSIKNAFSARHAVGRDFGKDTADIAGLAEAGAKGKSATLANDAVRNFDRIEKALIKQGVNPEELDRKVTPYLEAGKHAELEDMFRKSGRVAEADFVRAADELRQLDTKLNVEKGLVNADQLHDVSKYVPHTPTKEFAKFLNNNKEFAENILGYTPTSTGYLKNAGAKLRKLGGTVEEANAQVRKLTNGEVKAAFEDRGVRAIGSKFAKTLDNSTKVDILKGYQSLKDAAGNPLVIQGVDNSQTLNRLRQAEKQAIKAIDDEINSVSRKAAASTLRSKFTQREIGDKVARATKALDKAKARASHLGVTLRIGERDATKAAKAGVKNVAPQAALRDRIAALKQLADEATSNPADTRPSKITLVTDAELASIGAALKAAEKSLEQETAREAGRAGSRRVQRAIGSAQTAKRYDADLLKIAQREVDKAIKERDKLVSRQQELLTKASAKELSQLDALKSERSRLLDSAKAQKQALKAAEKVEKPAGYVKVNAGPLGHFYAPKSVADRLGEIDKKAAEPGAFKILGDTLEGSTQTIKNLLLNAPPFFVARTNRDLFGNVIAMWSKGFKNPKAFGEAFKIQKSINDSTKAGLTYAEAVAKLPAKQRELEQAMADRGTVNSGQIRADVSHGELGIARSRGRKVWSKLNPKNAESYYTQHGAHFNEQVDDVSRRAMFIDQVWQHGNFDEAALNTKEALFDYADLGEGEKAIKRAVPFYTFMTRNVGLQKWALQNVPQKTLNIERMRQELAGDGEESGDAILPQYALRSGQIPIANIGGTAILGGLQTPFQAAEQAVQPAVDIASFAAPEKYTTQENLSGGTAGLLQNIGGAGGGIAKGIAETATGTDLFTGAPIQGTKRERAWNAGVGAVPRGKQLEGLLDKIRNGTKAERTAALLALLGPQTTAVTEKREAGESYRRKRALEDAAERQGIPTLTELKKQGNAKKKSPATTDKSAATAAKLRALRGSGG